MDNVSFITNLSDENQKWLLKNLIKIEVDPGEVLVTKGQKNDRMYLIESGLIGVALGNDFKDWVSELGPGRMVGEVSFLMHSEKAIATLVAAERSKLLYIRFDAIQKKIDSDIHFAVDFYKSIGKFIARKLKRSNEM